MWFYGIARLALRVLLPLQMRLRVVGAERCPATGPVIIVMNHLGLLDPLIVAARLPRRIRILAKAEVFGWFFVGWVARHTGIVPVRRGASDREALRTLAGVLAAGECVLLLPEGTYPKPPLPPAMLPAKTGAAFLALRSGALVLPVGVTGTERVWVQGRGWRLWQRPRVAVTFGAPFRPQPPPPGVPPKLAYQMVADDMARRCAALLPPAYRGYYAASVGEAASVTPPVGTGHDTTAP
jgi:1-acyl-sn-glycerol-3-phosphate acyltransferase